MIKLYLYVYYFHILLIPILKYFVLRNYFQTTYQLYFQFLPGKFTNHFKKAVDLFKLHEVLITNSKITTIKIDLKQS